MSHTDLAEFLAHSVELESEARDRYLELADAMLTHHNAEVADFFARMANESSLHLEEVAEIASGIVLPEFKPWDFNWPEEESPETASYEAIHYRLSLREAIQLALKNELAAQAFYSGLAQSSPDSKTRELAARFAQEESQHAAQLLSMLDELPADGLNLRQDDDEPHMPE